MKFDNYEKINCDVCDRKVAYILIGGTIRGFVCPECYKKEKGEPA